MSGGTHACVGGIHAWPWTTTSENLRTWRLPALIPISIQKDSPDFPKRRVDTWDWSEINVLIVVYTRRSFYISKTEFCVYIYH